MLNIWFSTIRNSILSVSILSVFFGSCGTVASQDYLGVLPQLLKPEVADRLDLSDERAVESGRANANSGQGLEGLAASNRGLHDVKLWNERLRSAVVLRSSVVARALLPVAHGNMPKRRAGVPVLRNGVLPNCG